MRPVIALTLVSQLAASLFARAAVICVEANGGISLELRGAPCCGEARRERCEPREGGARASDVDRRPACEHADDLPLLAAASERGLERDSIVAALDKCCSPAASPAAPSSGSHCRDATGPARPPPIPRAILAHLRTVIRRD